MKFSGLTKILKVKICVFKSELSSCSEKTEPITRDHIKSSQMWNKTPLQLLNAFPSSQNRYNISIF